MEITRYTSGDHVSPYAKLSRQGATLFPRVLFFVDEIPNPDDSQRR